jgi:MFS family permease
MLIVFRFVAGCFGGAPMAIGGGVVSDSRPPGQRARLMAWYSVGTMMSPNVGLMLDGVITGGLGGDGYSESLLSWQVYHILHHHGINS